MIWNPFGPKTTPPPAARTKEVPTRESMMRAVAEKRKEQPLIGPIIVSREILARLMKASTTERGVHIESALARLAALAGYACQAGVRAELVHRQGLAENKVFIRVETQGGGRYFMGDPLNKPLVESQHSVWSLALGMARHLGWKGELDLDELFRHVAGSLGSPAFGQPRLPEGHPIGEPLIDGLKVLWPAYLPLLKDFCASPLEWPIAYAMAVQQLMEQGKAVLEPGLALRLVMECAVPMSKVDLEQV